MQKAGQTLKSYGQNYYGVIIKAIAIAILTITLFSQDLAILFNDALGSETTSYILAIPFIFAYLVYRKRHMLRATTAKTASEPKQTKYLLQVMGVLLVLSAVMFYWYGSNTFTPMEYHLIALPVFAGGLILLFFNLQTLRQIAFPLVFLAFLTPPPFETLDGIGATMSAVSSQVSNIVVSALGIPSTLSTEFGNPTITAMRPDNTAIKFTIDIACSGIYSLIGFFIFAVFIGYIVRDKLWKKSTLLVIGLPIIFLLNIVRITTIVLIGYQFGEDLALELFHMLGGWVLVFLGTLMLLFVSERVVGARIFSGTPEKCPTCSQGVQPKKSFCPKCGRVIKVRPTKISKGDIMKFLVCAISIALLMTVQVPVFALAKTPQINIITTSSGQQSVSSEILPQIQGYDLIFWGRDTDFEATAKQDMALQYVYTPHNTSDNEIWVAIEIASVPSSLHRWETCVIKWQALGAAREIQPTRDVVILDNPQILGRYFAFQVLEDNESREVLYWYETATFAVNSTSQQKYVKVSIETWLPNDLQGMTGIEGQMLYLAKQITNHWQQVKSWSQAALLLSQNGNKLTLLSFGSLVGIVVIYLIDRRNRGKANFNACQKLSSPNKQVIDAVHETQKTTLPTLGNIASKYEMISGNQIRKRELLEKLREATKAGILEDSTRSKQDEPIQTWKTNIAFRHEISIRKLLRL
jgi:exosortase